MNPSPIISVQLVFQYLSSVGNILHTLANASANQMILKPLIGPLNLSLSRSAQGVDWFDVAIEQNPFPLRINVVGEFSVLRPYGLLVSIFHVSEDGMLVGIIRERCPILQNKPFSGLYMCP